jgi:hypothetical protein
MEVPVYEEHHLEDLSAFSGLGIEHEPWQPILEINLTAQDTRIEAMIQFRLDTRWKSSFFNFGSLNTRKFQKKSSGLEEAGGSRELSDTGDFTNFFRPAANETE